MMTVEATIKQMHEDDYEYNPWEGSAEPAIKADIEDWSIKGADEDRELNERWQIISAIEENEMLIELDREMKEAKEKEIAHQNFLNWANAKKSLLLPMIKDYLILEKDWIEEFENEFEFDLSENNLSTSIQETMEYDKELAFERYILERGYKTLEIEIEDLKERINQSIRN